MALSVNDGGGGVLPGVGCGSPGNGVGAGSGSCPAHTMKLGIHANAEYDMSGGGSDDDAEYTIFSSYAGY